jgi:hypothetical protein
MANTDQPSSESGWKSTALNSVSIRCRILTMPYSAVPIPVDIWDVLSRFLLSSLLCSADTANKTNKLHGLSSRANYTDRATAACRRSDCHEGDGTLRPYSRFSMQEPLLFYQVAPQMYSRDWVDPVPDPLLFFLVVPVIDTGPPDL